MRTVKFELSAKNGNNLMKQLLDVNPDYEIQPEECVDGVLQDNYFYSDMTGLKIGRYKTREYVMFLENYVNEWSSDYMVIMTDSYNVYNRTLQSYIKDYEEQTGVSYGE